MPQTNEDKQAPTATVRPLGSDANPWAIAKDPTLDRATKLARLRQLELDVRLVENSLQEGMLGNTPMPTLAEVLAAREQVENAA